MRLFTGIALPYTVRRNLELLTAHLSPAARIRWSPVANLHITTKFIGEWEETRLEELKEALQAVRSPGQPAIAIRGLGWFPNANAPRIFWAGVEGGEALTALARSTEERLARIGAPVETRPYAPHLTLARIESPGGLDRLREAVAALPTTDFGRFTADRFILYQSTLKPGGSVYTALANFPL